MKEQDFLQPNKFTQGFKKCLIIIVFATVMALIVGAGVYIWKESKLKSTEQFLQRQISVSQNQIKRLQDKKITQDRQIQQPIINEDQNINQQKIQPQDIDIARESLIDYFNLLNEKRYGEAVKYHGSGYDYLYEWNPDVDKDDYAGLMEGGCEHNGLVCFKIKNVLGQEKLSPEKFSFVVQLEDDDGNVFKFGPCCGLTEEDMPIQAEFLFIVEKINDNFVVTSQPVYVP